MATSLISDLRLSRVPLAAFVSIGLFWGTFAAILPDIKARLDVNDAQLGLILLGAAAGALLSMALAPRYDAVLPRFGLPLAGLAMALAILPLGAMNTVPLFVIGMIAIGTTTGLFDILGNVHVSRIEARHDLSLMNLNHGFFSLAYALAAAVTGLAREVGLSPALWFALIGTVVFVLAAMSTTVRTKDGMAPDAPQASRGRTGHYVFLAGLVVLIGFISENATEGWSALHIERTLGGGAVEGALGPAMLGLTMAIGRISGHFVTVRGSEPQVLFWSALLAAGGLMTAALAQVPAMAYLGFGLLGLGVSVVGPLAIALAGQKAAPGNRSLAVSRAAMIGYFGFFIGPPLMGFLSEAFSLRVAFGVGAVLLLCIPLFLLPRMNRHAAIQGVDAS